MGNKKLYRTPYNSVFFGVCGGLAEYFDVDVTMVRLGTAVLVFAGGLSLWIYIIAAFIMPKKPY